MTERAGRWRGLLVLALLALVVAVPVLGWLTASAPGLAPVHYAQADRATVPMPALPEGADSVEEVIRLTQSQQPPRDAVWQPVALPDVVGRPVLGVDPDGKTYMRWYRLRHPLRLAAGEGRQTPLGLYLPRVVAGPIQVRLRQGTDWATLYRSDDTWREEWNRPLLVRVPEDVVAQALSMPPAAGGPAPGELEFWIGTSLGYRPSLAISSAWIGPLPALRLQADVRRLAQLQAPMATSVAILLVGLFALGVWWQRGSDQAYLLFALAAVVWAFRNLHYYISLPRDDLLYTWFWWATNLSLAWVMVLVYRFAMRFDDREHPWFDRLMLTLGAAVALLTLPLLGWQRDLVLLQHGLQAVIGLMATVYMSILGWRGGGPELRAIALVSWLSEAMGVHDLLLVGQRISPESLYLMPYAPLLVFGSFLYATLRRYLLAIEGMESANLRLEARLHEREALLEQNHARLREIERAQTLMRERERLMADMHDGIGSTLMGALIGLEQGRKTPDEAAEAVRECIDDLRLIIDSLEPIDHDLGTLLATLRYRLARRLDGAGVALSWQMDDLPPLPWMGASDALQVLRLLQEVLANVLKHAQARQVAMSAAVTEGGVLVQVRDDGIGFDPSRPAAGGRGRGLDNLRRRAQALGARLQIDSAPGQGARVALLLPLSKA